MFNINSKKQVTDSKKHLFSLANLESVRLESETSIGNFDF